MLVGEDEDNAHSLQRETSEISSQLDDFPKHIHILVVDANFNTLLDMKKIMMKYAYEVSVETDGEKALAYLTMCKHDINLVVWDFNMPGVNGIQALKDIGSKLDIPVVIMSDDTQSDSLMEAIINGACAYITKPVPEDIMSNMWQHIVRKRMISEPEAPVQSNLAQSNVLDKGKAVSMAVDQEQDMKRKEKKEGKRTWTAWTEVIQLDKPDLVQTNELYQLSDGSTTINQANEEEEKPAKIPRKDRMTWDLELHQKFLEAIELIGGIKRACPKGIHECLEQIMNVQGLSRSNVGSHLQKHRLSLDESRIPKHSQLGLSTTVPSSTRRYQRSNKGLLRNHSKNVQTASSSSSSFLRNAPAVNPIQQNQYQNSYLPRNNHQLITNQLYSPFRHSLYQRQPQQQQYYSSSHPFKYVMNNEEPGQASGTYVDHLFNQHQPQEEKYQSASRLFNYLMSNKEPVQARNTFPHQHQPQKYQSASHLLNYVVGNEKPGQASNTYVDHLRHQHQSQQPQYQSFSHLLNYGMGNNKAEQASGTYVGPLHQNQQQPHQYQSPHQFNYVVGNEEPGQASGTYVGPLHQNQQYQSPHQFNSVVGNEEPGQASGAYVGTLHQNQQHPQQYQSPHQFDYVVGNEEPGQAFGTYVGPLHQNQQHPQKYQSPHQFNYVVDNEEPDQASGIGVTGLEPTYPSVPQPQQYQSSHQFNSVMSNEEPEQASSTYVDDHLLPQHQPQPQQNQSSHQLNYMMSNEEPDQASGIGVTGLEPTYPSVPQPQQSQSSNQFNHVMSDEEPQQASGIGATGLELTYPSVPQPQPQQYQSSHQFNHVMSNEEPQQASGIGATDLELTYPSVPYDPFEDLMDGYNFSE